MKFSADCTICLINKMNALFRDFNKDEEKRFLFLKKIFQLFETVDDTISPPELYGAMMQFLNREINTTDVYAVEKNKYNMELLHMEQDIQNHIRNDKDPLKKALQYAMAGNYIDFAVHDSVDIIGLKEILNTAGMREIDTDVFERFKTELAKKKTLLYLLDNSGEIVLDKLLIRTIKDDYPGLVINAIVRGAPVLNDVTLTDAMDTGLCDLIPVYENGTAIPGTVPGSMNAIARELLYNADMIISKGQGNFESLTDSGLNIYYIFLCKCSRFVNRFNLQKYDGVFMHEREYEKYAPAVKENKKAEVQ